MNRWWPFVFVLLALCSCNDSKSLLPKSGGNAYEVVLTGDNDSSATRLLEASLEGLPQQEPVFKIVLPKGSKPQSNDLSGLYKYSHSILQIVPKGYWTEKNKYAEPQLIIHSDTAHLNQAITLLNRFEMKCLMLQLGKHRNIKAEKIVKQMFGISMHIPQDMSSSMKRQDFLWLSNNSATAMQNIVIMRGNADEMLQKNLKGETDSMYVCLRPGNLWEMKGDAMGGPYRAVKVKGTDITVIVFTYAPGKEKRNLIRQLEAVLLTIQQYGK